MLHQDLLTFNHMDSHTQHRRPPSLPHHLIPHQNWLLTLKPCQVRLPLLPHLFITSCCAVPCQALQPALQVRR